jgi:hypothetical protein
MVHPRVAYLGFPHPEAVSAASDSTDRATQIHPAERDPTRVWSRPFERGAVGPSRRSPREAADTLGRAR